MLKLSSFETRTCRMCQGLGCIHCNHKGTFRVPLYRKIDPALAQTRNALGVGQTRRLQSETEKTLAFLRAA